MENPENPGIRGSLKRVSEESALLVKSKDEFFKTFKIFARNELPSDDYEISIKNGFLPVKNIETNVIYIVTGQQKLRSALSKLDDKKAIKVLQKYAKQPDSIIITENQALFFDIAGAASVIDKEYSDDDAKQFFIDVLTDASRRRASDIHIIWKSSSVAIKYRVDGKLKEQTNRISKELGTALKNILINRAGESEYEENEVAGQISEIIDGEQKEYRVSIGPTVQGNVIVVRLESHISNDTSLEKWGYSPRACQLIRDLFDSHHGIVLVTGATGSGKSTLLYTCIIEKLYQHKEYAPEILTVEDPVEIPIDGINQIAVNTKGKEENWMTFSRAIKMFLRQDPDMIVVGEIRDSEVAMQAVTAAKTGHLTASTLHTNDVKSTFSRLRELGVENANIEDGVRGVLSQRLLNRLCNNCKIEYTRHGVKYFKRNTEGCQDCDSSSVLGCKGRVPVVELAVLNNSPENYKPENFEDYYSIDENIIYLLEEGIIDEEEAARWIHLVDDSDIGKRKEMLEIWSLATKDKDASKYIFPLFQPILDSRDYITGYEALVRMKTLDGNVISPKHFLTLSKKMGMYSNISMLILDQLIAIAGRSEKKIFWNIDEDNIMDKDFFESFLAKIQKGDLSSKFVLEFKFDQKYKRFIELCNVNKIQVSLDNFNANMTDIVFIERNNLVIDYIKTNDEFISGTTKQEKWMDDYLDLCKHMDSQIIVNYIETDPMFATIKKAFGTKIVGYQGYGIRRPDMIIDELNSLDKKVAEENA